jgi:hypothetical protein
VTVTDLGTEALQSIFAGLFLDEAWTTRDERSFSWIGDRLAQTISASPMVEVEGVSLSRLVADCVVVESVRASDELIVSVLSDLNRHAFGSCYSYYPDERQVLGTTSVRIHSETAEWRTRSFAAYATGQLIVAEAEADYIAHKLSGRVAVRRHPSSGERSNRDDRLNDVTDMFIPEGQAPSKFASRLEFETIAEAVQNSPFAATLGGSEDGIALETTFDEYTALSMLYPRAKHRLLGSGLLCTVQIPTEITHESGCHIAALLNRQEREGGPRAPHYGAWCVDSAGAGNIAVTYRFFVPNGLYRNGVAMDAAVSCVARARWVDLVLNTEMSPPNAWEQLARRFGLRRRISG